MASLLDDRDLQGIRNRFHQEAEAFLREAVRTGADNEDTKKQEQPLPRLNIHSIFWILTSVGVTYYVGFLQAVQGSLQEGCLWLLVGFLSLVVSIIVALYCIAYLEWYCGVCDYDAKYPGLVPVAIVTFLVAAVCFNVSLWPVWAFFTPVILFIQFMGFVMLISLLG